MNLTRREFCIGASASLVLALTGCRERIPVLRVPENADDCVDLFRFFTDPAFGLEQARAGLGLTGEPRILDDPKSRKLYTYEYEEGGLRSIGLQTGPDGAPDAGKLDAIYISYRLPIEVSLRGVERYLGKSDARHKKVAAQLQVNPIAMFTNLLPGQKEKEVSSYSFYPEEPIAPGHLKGDFLFSCDATTWDTKSVDGLRYQRRIV